MVSSNYEKLIPNKLNFLYNYQYFENKIRLSFEIILLYFTFIVTCIDNILFKKDKYDFVQNPIKIISLVLLILMLITSGCGGAKEVKNPSQPLSGSNTEVKEKIEKRDGKNIRKVGDRDRITIKRNVNGKDINIILNEDYEHIWYNKDSSEDIVDVRVVAPGIFHYWEIRTDTVDDYGVPVEKIRRIPDKFEFFDSNYNKINEYDIGKNNPFLKNISKDVAVFEQTSDSEGTYVLPKSQQTGKEKVIVKYLWTITEFQDGFSKVLYKENSIAQYGQIINTNNYMVVLDSTGNEIFTHKINSHVSFPAVSRNGKYVLFSIFPVETVSNAGIKTQTEGFEIWYTENNKQIYSERNDNPDMWISEPFLFKESNLLKIDYTYPNSKVIAQKDYAFDPNSKILYSRIFTRDEYFEIANSWNTKYKSYKNLINYFDFEIKRLKDE